MKKLILFFLLIFCISENLKAQESQISNRLGLGFQLCQYQNDFGLGLNMTSPYFFYDHMAVRLRGNLVFYQHAQNNETVWSPYSNFSLGMIGVGGKVGEFIRLYGEGGVVLLLPSEEFSTRSKELGGYGLFGFEFYMSHSFNYYIEIGGVGIGANADKLVNSPIYSNGFLINVGFRAQF